MASKLQDAIKAMVKSYKKESGTDNGWVLDEVKKLEKLADKIALAMDDYQPQEQPDPEDGEDE